MAFSLRERFSWNRGGPQASDQWMSLYASVCRSAQLEVLTLIATVSGPLSRDLRSNLMRYPLYCDTPEDARIKCETPSLLERLEPLCCDRTFLGVPEQGIAAILCNALKTISSSFRVLLFLDVFVLLPCSSRRPPDYSSNLCPPKTCAI